MYGPVYDVIDLNAEGVVRLLDRPLALRPRLHQSGRRELLRALAVRNWVITSHVLTVLLLLERTL